MAQKISLAVVSKDLVAKDIYVVTFRLVDPPTISFHAGQNMMLMVAPGVNRTMSIASPPTSSNELLMVHDVSPMGPGSKWTLGLKVGDNATIVAPTGGALMPLPTTKRKVFIATGTGIAPFRAILLDAFSNHSQIPMTLYWGLRYQEDVYWKNDFDLLAQNRDTFTWHLVLSKPPSDWQGLTGHVTEHVMELEKDYANSEYYLCGNKAMIEEVRTKLLGKNVPKEQIKSELFF